MRTIFPVLQIAAIVLLVALSSSNCLAYSRWNGTYVYEDAIGKTVGGSPISMKYVLVISKKDCSLSIDGFQTMNRIKCRADAEDDILHVRFTSYQDGAIANEFGVQVYAVDQILFELSKSGDNVITTWKAELPDEGLARKGIYFKKVDE